MCFLIDRTAKQPRIKYAWKLVRFTKHGYLRSVVYDTGAPWSYPGAIVRRSPGSTVRESSWHTNNVAHASRGIYVYRRLRDAEYEVRNCNDLVILKVEVLPTDWLYSSVVQRAWHLHMSTYEKVRVAEDQPYLEWY